MYRYNFRRSVFVSFICSALPLIAFAQEPIGLPAAFVDVGMGARPMAMAGAYSAMVQDASAIFWNPGSLPAVAGKSVFLSYSKQFGLIPYNAVSLAFQIGEAHGFAAGTIASGDEELQETTVLAGYGIRLDQAVITLPFEMSAGVAVKWQTADFGNNRIRLDDFGIFPEEEVRQAQTEQVRGNASGIGVDLGIRIGATPRFSYGFTWSNLINTLSWDNGEEKYREAVPGRLSFGAAYHREKLYHLALEIVRWPSGATPTQLRLGAERQFLERIFVRAGSGQNMSAEPHRNYALGLGLMHTFEDLAQFNIDYAYVVHPLANTQRFSLLVRF